MASVLPPRQGHGIRPLKTTRLPQSVIVFAANATLGGDRHGYEERWRYGHARFRRTGGKRKADERTETMWTPSGLWKYVTAWCGYEGVTHMWVCDVSWVARISELFMHLPALGWTLDAFSLAPGASWMVWRRKRAVLKVLDVMTLWPEGMDRVATLFGLGRMVPPPTEQNHILWQSSARRDCEILATAVDSYMDWIQAEDLGGMAITGNAQAWCAFRRRFMTHGILIHDDPDARAAERRAMWTGRCEAYWHGPLDHAVIHEWDLSNAYTYIVSEYPVPTLLHGPVDPGARLRTLLDEYGYILLAEVDVDTPEPVVPTLHNGAIVWPVGQFRTTLWEPEIREALNEGADVRLVRAWRYRASFALQDWATWVFDKTGWRDDSVPVWQQVLVKRWGNVLIGRFAMQYPQWKRVAWNPEYDVKYTPVINVDTAEEYALMQVGHEVWKQTGMRDAHNAAPQVTGYVMSLARVQLWRLMRQIPPRMLLYVDTDSLLVRAEHRDYVEPLLSRPAGHNLRHKRTWAGMEIYGPRQIVTGDAVRIAGVAKGAERTDWHSYEGEVTEGLTEALASSRLDAVKIIPRQWDVVGTDTRRIGSAVGWTAPFILGP